MLTVIVAILMYKAKSDNGVWLPTAIVGDCYIVRLLVMGA